MKLEGIFAAIYADAERETGKTEAQLLEMAVSIFGTMLHHMMEDRGTVIWTAGKLEDSGRLNIEVSVFPRYRTAQNPPTILPGGPPQSGP